MQFQTTDAGWIGATLMVVAALVFIGWAITLWAFRRILARTVDALRREMDERTSSLMIQLRAAQPVSQSSTNIEPDVPAVAPLEATTPPSSTPAPGPPLAVSAVELTNSSDEISPEIILIIAAAVTAFMGKKVRIRSATLLQTPFELFNPWAQQGRVVVQASHNLPQRGHWE